MPPPRSLRGKGSVRWEQGEFKRRQLQVTSDATRPS